MKKRAYIFILCFIPFKYSYVTFDEFLKFEELLNSPDVLYKCAFRIFDQKSTGHIGFGTRNDYFANPLIYNTYSLIFNECNNKNAEDFKKVIEQTTFNKLVPFDFESQTIKNYFGKNKKKEITFQEFTQLITVGSFPFCFLSELHSCSLIPLNLFLLLFCNKGLQRSETRARVSKVR